MKTVTKERREKEVKDIPRGEKDKRNYILLAAMMAAIVIGAIAGWLFPVVKDEEGRVIEQGASVLKPLGTLFINMMYCIVVPMVFSSIASAVANIKSRRRAGKIMTVTMITFVLTGMLAGILMYVVMLAAVPFLEIEQTFQVAEFSGMENLSEILVNLVTVEDFSELLSCQNMLPLIVFSALFGMGVNLTGGRGSMVAVFLEKLAEVMTKMVHLVTYYAPVAFFGFFANLVAEYGPQIMGAYGRTLLLYYIVCFAYLVTVFPLMARLGGGKGAVKEMFHHILRPVLMALATCSSIATIPTNMEEAEDTGISKDISEIVLPLGATVHMDGCCLSCVLKIVFVLCTFGMDFRSGEILGKLLVVAVISSIGMSGTVGGAYVGEYIMCSLFFPQQMDLAFPILLTLGSMVDPPATMINSSGDYVVCYMVERFVDGKDWMRKRRQEREEQLSS